MDAQKKPESLLPLPPFVAYILLLLTQGNRHTYKIYSELRKKLSPMTTLGTTTVYRLIERMVREGLIEESLDRPDEALDDDRRVYFRITEFGQAVLRADAQRQAEFAAEFYDKIEDGDPNKGVDDESDIDQNQHMPPSRNDKGRVLDIQSGELRNRVRVTALAPLNPKIRKRS